MKRFIMIFSIILLAISGLKAEPKPKVSFFINSGIAFPQWPKSFNTYWKTALDLGAGINLPVSQYFAFQGGFGYYNFGFNVKKYYEEQGITIPSGRVEGGAISIMTITMGIKGSLIPESAKIRPYFTANTGFFKLSCNDMTIYSSWGRYMIKFIPETKVGIMIGAGVECLIAPGSALFVDLNYGIGYTHINTEYVPLRVGIVFR
jgi:opacity protein-like surface antigen